MSEAIDLENPIAESLLRELSSLDQEMKMMETEKPQLEAFVVAQEAEVERVNKEIAAREQELAAAISANDKIAEMGNRNTAAARVVGRISLFLENFATDEELRRLEQTQSRLENRISALERQIGKDDAQDRLLSVLNGISSKISGYVQELGGEFGAYPARLDLRRLTVVFDRPGRLTYMDRTGGGENHLAYHLGTLLSLHRYAFEGKHPIPRFLMIDQPSQVYFPTEDVYKSVGGSIERTEGDSDMETVRRLFRLLHDYTQKHVPGFQIIVTEHANLRDDWYQSAIIETPWTKPPALVPESWF